MKHFDIFNLFMTANLMQQIFCQEFRIRSVEFNPCVQATITARVSSLVGNKFTFNWLARPNTQDLELYQISVDINGQITMQKSSNSFLASGNYDVVHTPIENSPNSPFDSVLTIRNFPKNQSVSFAIGSSSNEDRRTIITPSCTFRRDIYCDNNCRSSTPCSSSFTKVCLDKKSVVQNCPADVSRVQNATCAEVSIVCSITSMVHDHLAPVGQAIESAGLGDVLPFECMDGYTGEGAEYTCTARNGFMPMAKAANCSPLSSRNLAAGLVIGILFLLIFSGLIAVVNMIGLDKAIDMVFSLFQSKKKDERKKQPPPEVAV